MTPSGREVVVRRLLPAPPPVVFREWTDVEAFRDWMCPRPATATRVELDPRVGGRLRIDIVDGPLEFTVTGEYVELDAPSRIAFTWHCSNWPDRTPTSLVTITIDAHGADASLMTIRHALLTRELRPRHEAGWRAIAEQLAGRLAGRPVSEAPRAAARPPPRGEAVPRRPRA